MEIYQIVFSIILLALVIYFSVAYLQGIEFLSQRQKELYLYSVNIENVINTLWGKGCINSTLYTLTSSDIKRLSSYKCKILPCMSINPYPVFIRIKENNKLIEFGICPLDTRKCDVHSIKVIVDKSKILNMEIYICLDDLSLLTSTLQYYCNLNESFKYSFSTVRYNIIIKKDKVCINNICNTILCKRFAQTFDFKEAKTLYFQIQPDGFYKVIKIS